LKRTLTAILYIVLLVVALSAVHTIWIALADTARYQRVFPGARGPLYWITVGASAVAGLNALLIALRRQWAVWLNPVIGLWSIGLLRAVGSPTANQAIVLAACFVSTFLPWYLWRQGSHQDHLT
jgi:hypothetical protein